MSETRLELQIVSESKSAIDALDSLAAALGRVRTAASKGFTHDLSKNIVSFGQALKNSVTDGTVKRYEQLANAMERLNKASSRLGSIPGLNSAAGASGIVNASVRNSGMTQVAGQLESELAQSSDAITRASDALTSGTTQVGETIESSLGQAADAFSGAERQTKSFSTALKELFATTDRGHRPFSRLLSQFMRIAKLRVMREIIKSIMEGFKFGFENMYQYAKLVGNSFAPAVDAANNALFKMKNSLGAALAPAFQMIIPYVVQLVQWFINLVNIVNQFLALLRGQSTWTRATDAPASTLDKVKKSAKGATDSVKELKGLLADWDELNIIQQETGGGGGGSGSLADDETAKYGLLFEEVSTFDENVQRIVEKVKEFVQWIKDNMDTILNIAKLIGVAILGWKVSSWFGGIIGTLLGWATTGIIAALTFKMTLDYDEDFLATGDPGYLVKNILTSAVGATAAGILMKTITGSSLAGAVAFSAVLTVSATADIIAALGETDVSALSEKNLGLALVSALKLGLASTVLSKALGTGYMKSGLIGLGVTLLVLSAEVGIKAALGDAADAGAITGESVLAKVVSAVGALAGVTALGMGAFKLPFGSAFFTGLAAAGLLLTVEFGIQAVVAGANADVSGINWPSILLSLSSGMSAAGAVFSITKGKLGWSMGKSLFASASAALTTIAVELGVEAFVSTQNAGTAGVTTDSLIKSVSGGLTAFGAVTAAGKMLGWTLPASMQAGLIGAGAFLTVSLGVNAVVGTLNAKELTLNNVLAALGASAGAGIMSAAALIKGGASLSVAMAAGGVTALATGLVIAAAIGVALYLSQEDPIKWGNVSLTEEQVKEYVKNKMFTGDIEATLSLVNTTISASAAEKVKVRAQARKLFSEIKALKIGINDTASLKNIYEQVNGLITSMETYAETQTAVLKTGISVIPIINETGEDVSKEFLTSGITGWAGVTNYMQILGNKLSKALIDEATGEIKKDWDKDYVQALLDKVNNINQALTGAQAGSSARKTFRASLGGLETLDKSSFTKVTQYYKEYADEIKKSYTDMYEEEIAAYEGLAAMYYAMAENEAGTTKGAEYMALAKTMEEKAAGLVEALDRSVSKALDAEAAPARKMILDWINKTVDKSTFEDNFNKQLANANINLLNIADSDEARQDFITKLVANSLGIDVSIMDLLNISGWDLLSDSMKEQFMNAIRNSTVGGSDAQQVMESIGAAAEGYIGEYSGLSMVNAIALAIDKYGLTEYTEAGSDIGKMVINGLAQEFSDDAGGLVQMLADTFGWNIEDILGNIDFSQMDGEQMQQFLESWNNSDLGLMYELDIDEESFNMSVPAADTSALTGGLEQTEASVAKNCQNIRAWFESLNGLSFTFSGDAMGGSMSVNLPAMPKLTMAANGGLFTAGEMFIAREAGPEMVGRIGSRTGVANNNQIVDGITTGVASGQAEQNALLRQQNEYLRQMLAKESTVRVQPSTAWGEFNKKSSEMYARATGRG